MSIHSILRNALSTIACLALIQGTANAVDGVLLINQSNAIAGNVTPGDTPGFPVSINLPGIYKLSSNLVVPNENTTAIQINVHNVTIDLNGFLLDGGSAAQYGIFAKGNNLTVNSVWDTTDLTYVVRGSIIVGGAYDFNFRNLRSISASILLRSAGAAVRSRRSSRPLAQVAGDTFSAERGSLSKSAPVVDVRNRHVIKTAGDSVGGAVAHHRQVDDFCDFVGKNAREMADVAGVFDIRKRDALAFIAHVIEIAPDQFSEERRTDCCLRIVPQPRPDCSQFETVALFVTGAFRSFERTVPNNDAAARMAHGH